MGTYNVHAGHCPDGKGASGAVGYLKESTEARKVKDEVIRLVRAQGHTAYDCTCEDNTTQSGCLKAIVAKCNAHTVDLDVSIHLNAGGGTGTETLYYSNAGKAAAQKVQDKIVAQNGYKDRGVKYRDNLYVLKNTKATAILVECCFVDSQADANAWNVNKMAAAIVSGMLSKDVAASTGNSSSSGSTPAATTTTGSTSTTTTKADDWVKRLQKECNAQGFSNQTVDGIPGKNTLAGCPTCKSGAKGNITKLLQEKLNALGYNCGAVDGIFGAKTKAAVIAYQKAKGLTQDGIVGTKTWSKLLGLS